MVLAQPASASICERINSEFAFVKDRRRNSLAHSKANKLVGLFHNLRLLKRMRQVTYAEPAIAWTDDLEQSSVTKFEPAAIGSTSAYIYTTKLTAGLSAGLSALGWYSNYRAGSSNYLADSSKNYQTREAGNSTISLVLPRW